jgi:hypothetical protein
VIKAICRKRTGHIAHLRLVAGRDRNRQRLPAEGISELISDSVTDKLAVNGDWKL